MSERKAEDGVKENAVKRRWLRPLLGLGLLLLIGSGVWAAWQQRAVIQSALTRLGLVAAAPGSTALRASGFIEAPTLDVASEVSGRINRLLVSAGTVVTAGQTLAEMDTTLLDAQMAEADAAVALAEAQLARLEAGARAEDLQVAAVAVTVAETRRDGAQQAWQDAQALQANPQELDIQIANARAQLAVAEKRLLQATALKDAAEIMAGARARQVATVDDSPYVGDATKRQISLAWDLATADVWSAWANLNRASAGRAAAQQGLSSLQALRANPQAATIQAAQAEAGFHQAAAAVGVAQAALTQAQAGAAATQREVARRSVEQARAARAALSVLQAKYTLHAPAAGEVLHLTAHEGETAIPGVTLLSLGNLDTVDLVVYVPEPDMGAVQLGQATTIWADAFAHTPFRGDIVWIADQAEFTPKNVQTQNERAQTVFAVRLGIANPTHALKPGMGAEAVFGAAAAAGANADQPSTADTTTGTAAVQGSGVIEADVLNVTSEVGGRIVALHSAEGMTVTAGAPLIELDRTLLLAQETQAEAALATAQANGANVAAPPRREAIALAAADLAQAEAGRDGSYTVWQTVQAVITRPLELDARVAAADRQVALLVQQVDAAQAALKAAEIQRAEAARHVATDDDRSRGQAADKQVEAAQANQAAAEAELAGARRQVALLQALRAHPLALRAQANSAQAAYRQAQASVQLAQARLTAAQAGPQPTEEAVAQAQVEQAQAALAHLRAQLARLTVTAPRTGIVLEQAARSGELAAPGVALLRLADLDHVSLKIYVPAGQIGQMQIGQALSVTVDAYPGQIFTAHVSEIASAAEFTPKTVQNSADRANLVLAVKLSLDNADHRLKPGMPASVR
jgi:multidrug resistance efflux pump